MEKTNSDIIGFIPRPIISRRKPSVFLTLLLGPIYFFIKGWIKSGSIALAVHAAIFALTLTSPKLGMWGMLQIGWKLILVAIAPHFVERIEGPEACQLFLAKVTSDNLECNVEQYIEPICFTKGEYVVVTAFSDVDCIVLVDDQWTLARASKASLEYIDTPLCINRTSTGDYICLADMIDDSANTSITSHTGDTGIPEAPAAATNTNKLVKPAKRRYKR